MQFQCPSAVGTSWADRNVETLNREPLAGAKEKLQALLANAKSKDTEQKNLFVWALVSLVCYRFNFFLSEKPQRAPAWREAVPDGVMSDFFAAPFILQWILDRMGLRLNNLSEALDEQSGALRPDVFEKFHGSGLDGKNVVRILNFIMRDLSPVVRLPERLSLNVSQRDFNRIFLALFRELYGVEPYSQFEMKDEKFLTITRGKPRALRSICPRSILFYLPHNEGEMILGQVRFVEKDPDELVHGVIMTLDGKDRDRHVLASATAAEFKDHFGAQLNDIPQVNDDFVENIADDLVACICSAQIAEVPANLPGADAFNAKRASLVLMQEQLRALDRQISSADENARTHAEIRQEAELRFRTAEQLVARITAELANATAELEQAQTALESLQRQPEVDVSALRTQHLKLKEELQTGVTKLQIAIQAVQAIV